MGLVVLGMAGVVSVAACDPHPGADPEAAAGAGSGLENLTPDQIVAKSREADAGLTSLRGTVRLEQESGTLEYALSVDRNGACSGTVSQGGVDAEVRRQGGTVWVKPPAAMLRAMVPDAGPELADKWLTNAGLLGGLYAGYCDAVLRFATDGGPLKPADAVEWSRTAVRPVGGTRAVILGFHPGGGAGQGGPGTVAIAADGPPYLLSVDQGGKNALAMRFDAFGEPVAVTPPPADQVVDAGGYRITLGIQR
ncbi:hypothetical protein KCH_31630 [Kitasatospora cheerisanensis KCTC 2395]|uniref:Lipoprotein n=1 Tax=Kitasatospora cheerisanensis KCTC 2395 TaxID=1348663 RepID=A0A066YYJ4_9ACTN|nr:hypothetical protein KCH_31630 [Kitasatospora cheerisanensis KCTC 2395]